MPNESPLESVLKSDLGKIMTYLSWKSATNSYEKLYNELISKKYKNK
jgi:hypothetical protein